MKKISVIVPVYNTEKYISKCIDSIIEQEYPNIEIIIVDDGSTDASGNIAAKYAIKHNNIKYYKKVNGGLSDARNYGVEKSSGDYICFVDSDDYIDTKLFEELGKYMNNEYDIIKYGIVVVDELNNSKEEKEYPAFECKNGTEAFNILYKQDKYMQPAVLYLFRKAFWIENNFSFPVGMYHEDFAIIPLIILKAKSVISTGFYGYYYVQSPKSITRGNDDKKIMQRAMDALYHYDNMLEEIKKYSLDQDTTNNLKAYYTNCIITKVSELSESNKKTYIAEIKKRKMYSNIKVIGFKQLIKRILLYINIELYLKLKLN